MSAVVSFARLEAFGSILFSFFLIFSWTWWNWEQACWHMLRSYFLSSSLNEIMKSLVQVQCDLHFNWCSLGWHTHVHACVSFLTLFNAILFSCIVFFAPLFGLHVSRKFAVSISIPCVHFDGWITWHVHLACVTFKGLDFSLSVGQFRLNRGI